MPREPLAAKRARAVEVQSRLSDAYPDACCSLNHSNPLELLVATILAAQCTDERVNQVTPSLFRKYPNAQAYFDAPREDLEQDIHSCGFYRNKAKNIQSMCRELLERHGGQVPGTMEELLRLAGVGRKTANVLLGECFGAPGIIVDTHCGRIARRLGFTTQEEPAKVERDLMNLLPKERWRTFSHCMVFHGRAMCQARAPQCPRCPVREWCPFPGTPEGRKVVS